MLDEDLTPAHVEYARYLVNRASLAAEIVSMRRRVSSLPASYEVQRAVVRIAMDMLERAMKKELDATPDPFLSPTISGTESHP